jgi:SecD/SecF fusion protein
MRADFGPTAAIVTLQFTNHGSSQFQKITAWRRSEARRSGPRRQARRPNNCTRSTSRSCSTVSSSRRHFIDFQQNPDGILRTPRSTSAGRHDRQSFSRLCSDRCAAGQFPADRRTDVSATLGKARSLGRHAALIGLLIVALFLLVLYRFLGLVAVVGLAIYASLYYPDPAFHVTLTLPGFAA